MSQSQQAILFLASWYPTPQNNNHGVFIKNHALALSKYSPVIVIYAYSSKNPTQKNIQKNKSGNFEEWFIEYKKEDSNVPIVSSILKLKRFKAAYKTLLKELIRCNISVKAIQLNTIFSASIALPLFQNHFKVPYTIVEHWSGYLPEDGNYKGIIQKYFTKKAVASASKIFYVSEKQKQEMLNNHLLGDYELLYNVVDTKIFQENKNVKSHKPILLHVSSLIEKEKNISGTLNVIKKLQQANYQFEFIIVGGNENLISHFKEKANRLGLINTIFVGEKTQLEVAAIMQKANALILFSNYEGMPVVVLEALAVGVPVFASRVGQLPYLITPEMGQLVNAGDEKELETKLKEFLEGKLKFDSKKMIDFIAENASQDVVGKKLADYYSTLCSSTNLVNSTN
ncbi:glycosyltransferase family 4 protein [Sediminibacterium sp.]|uniref:glycosyltransferase family 4 protein n=1 Tax=Sediminibacterium sp. TaxID=1917865 RepID=UPI0027356CC2|nr:glycosyltransferase [Sediminibacterium sp.]MDP3567302.1 glycosyltransferase [Sediminibacterium sp.]